MIDLDQTMQNKCQTDRRENHPAIYAAEDNSSASLREQMVVDVNELGEADAKEMLIEALTLKDQSESEARQLQTKLAETERAAQALRFEKSQVLRALHSEQEHTIQALRAERDEALQALNSIHESRAWKMMHKYWDTRRAVLELARKPYDAMHRGLRLVIPLEWRRRMLRLVRGGAKSNESVIWGETDSVIADATGARSDCYDVVCFPVIDWDFRFQRPQQLMKRLAAAGHRVFYLNQHFRNSGREYQLRLKGENIYEVSLRGLPRSVYEDFLDDKACNALFDSLNALRRDLSLGAAVAWAQLPFWWPLVERTRGEFAWPILYDCMDYHAGFSANRPEMLTAEESLLSYSDCVLVSSPFLQRLAESHGARPALVRNGCDYEHFVQTPVKPRGSRPVIGYYGAIADWFDSDLVADLAERRPDWSFVLVGSTHLADVSRLSQLSNLTLTGEKPYSELPAWLNKFDATIIPFKRNSLTEATNPVKAYEILAAGKPLVSVPLPEIVALGSLVRLASTAPEFEREIIAALEENTPQMVEQRRAFAREHTWEKRVEALAPLIVRAFPKASIIIVTYNNLELNQLCLESLYERTEWPNFEVIVVDNASTDGTPEYLREVERSFPNLIVVLNDSNLGFAAANNIGLKLASGEYLALLNNDTVVTRGWLSALIRHLSADRRLGLVGPVTNAIGNEAKIPVGYSRIEEMPDWAANYTRERDGQLLPISMLAMFCVAMRREVFEKVGLIDERFVIGMFEDDDYCHRVRLAGYEIRLAHDSFIHHWQMSAFRLLGEEEYLRIFDENRKRYEEKWRTKWNGSSGGKDRGELARIISRVRESKGAVIILPSVGWSIELFQRPHHLARAFAQHGYTVIFDCSNSHDEVEGFKEIESDLFLFRGDGEQLAEIPDALLWTFTYNYHQKSAFPPATPAVYDWIDEIEIFPYDRDLLLANHARALREATLVTSVARRLHDQARAARPDALYLPNGVENWRFEDDFAPVPDDPRLDYLMRQSKPIAGYYGALARWFDYDLLYELARLREDWNFVLIGPNHDQSINGHPLLSRPNVAWLGPREYRLLPGYLRCFDVATIPFVINDITLATSPLKLYEYFAGGKPVITTPMPECLAFPEVNIVNSAREFAEALDLALAQGQDERFRENLRRIARENSWWARANTVIERLRGIAKAGGSVNA